MRTNNKVEKCRSGRETIRQMEKNIDEALAPVMPEDWAGHERLSEDDY